MGADEMFYVGGIPEVEKKSFLYDQMIYNLREELLVLIEDRGLDRNELSLKITGTDELFVDCALGLIDGEEDEMGFWELTEISYELGKTLKIDLVDIDEK